MSQRDCIYAFRKGICTACRAVGQQHTLAKTQVDLTTIRDY